MQARSVVADGIVRHVTCDLVDLGDGALDRLKDLERVLVQNIEGALDPVIGDGVLVAIAQPGRESEKHGRQDHRPNHHQLQQPNC